jgi:hypothetical protein
MQNEKIIQSKGFSLSNSVDKSVSILLATNNRYVESVNDDFNWLDPVHQCQAIIRAEMITSNISI